MGIVKVLLFSLLCILPQIRTMSLEGTPQTRYDPCGLGVIYIDKLQTNNETIWKAVLNLDMYPEFREADVRINFEVPVTLVSISHKTMMVNMNEHDWNFIISEDLPKQFTFNLKVKNNDTVPKVKLFSLNSKVLCSEIEKASQTIDSLNLTKNDDSPQYSHVCGRRSIEHTELTTTGSASKRGDWPWHVAIFLHQDNSNIALYQCGGSIISRSTIITAGHCIMYNGVQIATEKIYIFAGTIDLKPTPDKYTQVRKAQKIILHPSYNDGDATADLAIIKVDELSFTEYVQPICMWGDLSFDKSSLFGMSATFAGFGITENKTFSYELRSARLDIQNDDTCVKFSPKLYKSLLNDFTICAGYGPLNATTPRNGDSGGGLILPRLQDDHKFSWFLRGVLSKCGIMPGESVCDTRHYVVYTDIGPHYMWIMHHSQLKYREL